MEHEVQNVIQSVCGKEDPVYSSKTVQEIIESDGVVIILFVDMDVKVTKESCGGAVIYIPF